MTIGRAEIAGAATDPVVDDDGWLQGANVVVEIVAASNGPRAFPLAVEPENADRSVAVSSSFSCPFMNAT